MSRFLLFILVSHRHHYDRTWIPSATALASFMAYTLIAGGRLTVSRAFTAISLFSQLQHPMTALPGHIFALFHGTFLELL